MLIFFALASAVISSAKLADPLRGNQLHAQIVKHWHKSDTCVASALVDMYARSGTIEYDHRVVETLL